MMDSKINPMNTKESEAAIITGIYRYVVFKPIAAEKWDVWGPGVARGTLQAASVPEAEASRTALNAAYVSGLREEQAKFDIEGQ